MSELRTYLAGQLTQQLPAEVSAMARLLAEKLRGDAVLFYGSSLRTGDLEGVLDFYVLRDRPDRRNLIYRTLWPDVSYHEIRTHGRVVRAKVATMTMATFHAAATGALIDTTIWTRFAQPSALAYASSAMIRSRVIDSIASAAIAAGLFAALHGPVTGRYDEYWRALFRATYQTELRVEAPGRADQILGFDPQRYAILLPLAWQAGGIRWRKHGSMLSPDLPMDMAQTLAGAWFARERYGKWLNVARLTKAAFTFAGASRYALWKIARHTGVQIALTPWRERHPILSAPGVVWQLWWTAKPR